ncbi:MULTISPECIES: hypothetical protein, partial [unclassified Pseudomonas]|uniref:hypothetical protein n=1 Tax=unclassified Pseudomonas TaxID=196821 RepID=UPI001C4368FD
LKVKISISSAYFSAVEAIADFFNRIGRKRRLTNDRFQLILLKSRFFRTARIQLAENAFFARS